MVIIVTVAQSWPDLAMTIFLEVLPLSEPKLSTFFTPSKPGARVSMVSDHDDLSS